jgi:hypothetical protein
MRYSSTLDQQEKLDQDRRTLSTWKQCNFWKYHVGKDELGIEKSAGDFDGSHVREGAVASHLDGYCARHIFII